MTSSSYVEYDKHMLVFGIIRNKCWLFVGIYLAFTEDPKFDILAIGPTSRKSLTASGRSRRLRPGAQVAGMLALGRASSVRPERGISGLTRVYPTGSGTAHFADDCP
jgi:hypothetical protein